MHGNVWEGAQDPWLASVAVSPARPDAHRVLRGDAFSDLPSNAQSVIRSRNRLAARADSYGMRVAKTYR